MTWLKKPVSETADTRAVRPVAGLAPEAAIIADESELLDTLVRLDAARLLELGCGQGASVRSPSRRS